MEETDIKLIYIGGFFIWFQLTQIQLYTYRQLIARISMVFVSLACQLPNVYLGAKCWSAN